LSVQAVGYERGAEEPAVNVYVTKSSPRLVKTLPHEIGSVPIGVKRIGAVTLKPELASSATNQAFTFERQHRVACGSSCAPSAEKYGGTFGALVKKSGHMYALSNNHVFGACNHTQPNMPILAPASGDWRQGMRPPGAIARHSEIVELRSGDPSFVPCSTADLAIARVEDEDLVSSWQGSRDGYDTPTKTADPSFGLEVQKVGRTTGLTSGRVEDFINTPTPISCQTRFFKATVWFTSIWTVAGIDSAAPFCLQGDSGSLVVTSDAKHAVGVVFAANRSGEYGLIVPIAEVLSAFGGLSLIGGHGV
jgi:hypothetical protein